MDDALRRRHQRERSRVLGLALRRKYAILYSSSPVSIPPTRRPLEDAGVGCGDDWIGFDVPDLEGIQADDRLGDVARPKGDSGSGSGEADKAVFCEIEVEVEVEDV